MTADTWGLLVQAATAVATLILAAVAIWGDFFRSWLAPPRLSLSLRDAEGEPTTRNDGVPARYYQVTVSNSRRWAPARNVSVYVKHLEKPAPDDGWQPAMFSGPVPLAWQFAGFFRVHPLIGASRYCDFGRVFRGGDFRITTEFTPNNFDGALAAPGKLRAHLVAVGENGESPPLVIEVAWDGVWVDGSKEMSRHLVVKPVSQAAS